MEQAGCEHRAGVPGGDDRVGLLRSATARTALTSEESGLARTASLGFSAMPITWVGDGERQARRCRGPSGPWSSDVDAGRGRGEGARDDLLRCAIPAQRVDGDAGHD